MVQENTRTARLPHEIISTADIYTGNHFFEAFGNSETEASAMWIVKFLQKRGQGWGPFTSDEINSFYQEKNPGETFDFNALTKDANEWASGRQIAMKGGWIQKDGDHYWITDEFILAVYKSSMSNLKSAAETIEA